MAFLRQWGQRDSNVGAAQWIVTRQWIGKAVAMAASAACLLACGRSQVDPRTLCSEEGPESTTALILDTSDPLAPHQIAALERFTQSLVTQPRSPDGEPQPSENYVAKGHLLVVYELPRAGDPVGTPRQVFEMCNPGSPEDRGAVDGFTEGEVAVMVRWSQFTKAMRSAFPDSASQASAPTSPIIETIRYVRNKEFPGPVDMARGQRRGDAILVISDLLQNSDLLSHYRGPLPPVDGLPQSLALNLSGIEIGVRYLRSRRDAHLQTGEHFAWWRDFLAEAGGPMTRTPESW